jgi:hypothetical protein
LGELDLLDWKHDNINHRLLISIRMAYLLIIQSKNEWIFILQQSRTYDVHFLVQIEDVHQ